MGVAQDDAQRGRDFVGLGPAADIQEIGRRAAVELDDIHRRHRQTRAVHHAADLAVELDVAQTIQTGRALLRRLVVFIAQRGQLGVAEQRAVVNHHFAIERLERAIAQEGQRVDLGQAGVATHVAVV